MADFNKAQLEKAVPGTTGSQKIWLIMWNNKPLLVIGIVLFIFVTVAIMVVLSLIPLYVPTKDVTRDKADAVICSPVCENNGTCLSGNICSCLAEYTLCLPGYSDNRCRIASTAAFINIVALTNEVIDQEASYTCDVSIVNVTTAGIATVSNLCSVDQLNINAGGESIVTVKVAWCSNTINVYSQAASQFDDVCAKSQANVIATDASSVNFDHSCVCPETASVIANDGSHILNVCATETMSIQVEDAGNVTAAISPCPRIVTSASATSGYIYNLCASVEVNINAIDGGLVVMQNTSCPSVATVSATYSGTVYVCATQTINAIAQYGGTVYYHGPLGATTVSYGGQLNVWW